MRLTIDNQQHTFLPIQRFREQFGLPAEFGVSHFAPVEFREMGSIENGGAALYDLRQAVLAAIPQSTPPEGWLTFALTLQMHFATHLRRVNDQIGLKPSEIEFAAAGFGELCQLYIYEALRARLRGVPPPDGDEIHHYWVNTTTALSRIIYRYPYGDQTWFVQLVRSAYGRVGIVVRTPDATYYLHDTQMACPAEGFIASLFRDVCDRLRAVICGATVPAPTSIPFRQGDVDQASIM